MSIAPPAMAEAAAVEAPVVEVGPIATNINTAGWNMTWDTRAAGHTEFIDGGLKVWTDDASSAAKVGILRAVDFPLSAMGAAAVDYTNLTPDTFAYGPGLQAVVDVDADGTPDGIIVGETVYGGDWWAAPALVKRLALLGLTPPTDSGGGGSTTNGTIAEWSAAFPDAKVVGAGFALGSGVHASGVVHSLTMGNTIYGFDYQKPLSVNQCTAVTTEHSTNLDTNGWAFTESKPGGHQEYVAGGLRIWTDSPDLALDKSAGLVPTNFALVDAGTPSISYTKTSGAEPGINMVLFVNGAWKGTLVYEPLFDGWWINKPIAGLPAGPNPGYQLAFGTLDEIVQAYERNGVTDVRIGAVGYSLGTGAIGDGVISSITAGCTTHTFAYQAPPTTTTVVGSPGSVFGTDVVFTATVAATSGTPTGQVEFSAGGAVLSTVTLSNGKATFGSNDLPVGTAMVTATYLGAPTFAGSVGTAPYVVTGIPTTTKVTSAASSVYGTDVVFTAAVASAKGDPAGDVAFSVDGVVLKTVPVTNGTATFTTKDLPVGTATVTASYLGAATYAASSGTASVEVTGIPTATSVVGSAPSVIGTDAVFTATVANSTKDVVPTGSVRFTAGDTVLGTVKLTGRTATLTTKDLPVGTSTVTATYLGAPTFAGSAGTVTHEVVKATTVTSVAKVADTIYGVDAVFTALVANGTRDVLPTGMVTFASGDKVLATVELKDRTATFTTKDLPVGTTELTVTYLGSATFAGSAANSTAVVLAIPTTTVVTAASDSPFGSDSTFTATVASAQGVPTGDVEFSSGGAVVKTVTLVNGVAAFTTKVLPVGTSTVTAKYLGAATYATSSGTTAHAVVKIITATTVAKVADSIYGTDAVFVATVSNDTKSNVPTGSVTFASGDTVLATVVLEGRTATFATKTLPVGTTELTVTYLGAPTYAGSATTASAVVTTIPTTTVVTSSADTPSGTDAGFTATVASAQGVPAGDVQFAVGGAVVKTVTLVKGVATFITKDLPVGSSTVTATYLGAPTYAASSGTATHAVVKIITATTVAKVADTIYGADAVFTATVATATASQVPTGSVSFARGDTVLATVALDGPTATFAAKDLPVGTTELTVTYLGAPTYAGSVATASAVVSAIPTTTVVTAGPGSVLGTDAAFTATVASAQGVPTGDVEFSSGTKVLKTIALVDGKATFTTKDLPLGTSTITAKYLGAATFASSTGTVPAVVSTIPTATVVTAGPESAYGANAVLTATVASAQGVPTGEVKFTAGTKVLKTVALADGVATLTTKDLPVGTSTVTATYLGAPTFAGSTGTADQVVAKASTETAIAGAYDSTYGSSVTFTATVTSAAGTPTGQVQYASGPTVGTDAVKVDLVDGKAVFTLQNLPVGPGMVTVTYLGSPQYAASAKTISHAVALAPTTTTLTGKTQAHRGDDVAFTATVASAAGVPAGVVEFRADGDLVSTVPLVEGKAVFTLKSAALGTTTVLATYTGSATHALSVKDVDLTVDFPPATGTPDQKYVMGVYRDLFGRDADPAGMATWSAQLAGSTPRVAVANAITYSTEFRTGLITESYAHYLNNRVPDAAGLQNWLGAMNRGWTVSQMESGFISSAEYYQNAGGTDAGWVKALYGSVLDGRTPAASEVSFWTTRLANGSSTREQVAMGFLLSPERLTTVVNGYYQTLLSRDIDASGQRTWVTILQGGGRDEAIIGGIIASAEYYAQS